MSRFLCLTISDFPARAAIYNEPSLRGQAVLVHAGGDVLSASPEARHAGIQTGWSLARAIALVPDVAALPLHGPAVAVAWQAVEQLLFDLTPQLETIRQGTALACIQPPSAIKELLRTWGGQAGCADDRATAEIAALSAPPGAIRTVRAGHTPEFLESAPMTLLSDVGICPDTIERLGWFGWNSIGHLRKLTSQQLVTQFEDGDCLHYYSSGSDIRPVDTYKPPASVSVHIEFEEVRREPGEIEPALSYLVDLVSNQLGNRVPQSLTLGLEESGSEARGHCLVREPTLSRRTLYEAGLKLLRGLLHPRMEVCGIRLSVTGFIPLPPVQGSLFRPRRPSVITAVRAVERRFPGSLRRIVTTNVQAPIPEEFYRLEPITIAETTKRKGGAYSSKQQRPSQGYKQKHPYNLALKP